MSVFLTVFRKLYGQFAGALLLAVTMLACYSARCDADDAGELSEQFHTNEVVQHYWFAEDFAKLEELASNWRSNRLRTQSGFWKLSIFYDTFEQLQRGALARDYPDGLTWQRVEHWIKAFPNSPTPCIVKSMLLVQQANKSPPYDLAEFPVKPWRPDIDLLTKAATVLAGCEVLAATDPHWHTIKLRLMRSEGRSDGEIILAIDEALTRHPLYEQTSFETFEYFADRWVPNYKLLDGFAKMVAEDTKATLGMAAYARLYARITPMLWQGQYFALSGRDWAKMESGLQRIDADFPSAWNTHQHALHACLARDRTVTAQQLSRAPEEQAQPVWIDSDLYEQCKSWAGQQ